MNNIKNNHQLKTKPSTSRPRRPVLGKGRALKGLVVSDKMNKTVVVAVRRLKEHTKYKKRYKVTKRYKAHDEKNECKIGDKVVIRECRPMSKEKRWIVKGFVQKSKSLPA